MMPRESQKSNITKFDPFVRLAPVIILGGFDFSWDGFVDREGFSALSDQF